MRFRKTLTFFMPVMGLVFSLPTWAQQKFFWGASAAFRKAHREVRVVWIS